MKKSDKCHLIVLGAQKAGTTWLHNTLEDHKFFWCPKDKQEVHYFDRYYDKGYKKYEKEYEKAPVDKVTFDVTPAYLCHPQVPERIKGYEEVSKRPIKLIALLRNPIDRAVSAYKMKVKKGGYNLKLSDAIKVDKSLVTKSRYVTPLKKYKKKFGKDLMLIKMEEMFSNAKKVMGQISNFVCVDNLVSSTYEGKKVNSSSEGMTPKWVQVLSNSIRYLGAVDIIHSVKKSPLSNILKYKHPKYDPVIDDDGIRILKEKIAEDKYKMSTLFGFSWSKNSNRNVT